MSQQDLEKLINALNFIKLKYSFFKGLFEKGACSKHPQ